MLKGPGGCGKTRFVEHMAHALGVPPDHHRSSRRHQTAADLVGRYPLTGGGTVWVDGPLTCAVRQGAICYLDEIVEARADTTVVLHPSGRPSARTQYRAAGRVAARNPGQFHALVVSLTTPVTRVC